MNNTIISARLLTSLLSILSIASITSIPGCTDTPEDEPSTEIDVEINRENPTPGDMVEERWNEPDNDTAGEEATESGTGATGHTYREYSNSRFNFTLEWPSDLVRGMGEADNGDGQEFVSNDGSLQMRAYGRNLLEKQSLQELYQERLNELPTESVSYKRLRAPYYVISGADAGVIYYEKTILQDEVIKRLMIRYPADRKQELDSVVTRISDSFRGVE